MTSRHRRHTKTRPVPWHAWNHNVMGLEPAERRASELALSCMHDKTGQRATAPVSWAKRKFQPGTVSCHSGPRRIISALQGRRPETTTALAIRQQKLIHESAICNEGMSDTRPRRTSPLGNVKTTDLVGFSGHGHRQAPPIPTRSHQLRGSVVSLIQSQRH